MSLTISNPYSTTYSGRNSKIHAFEVDAASDHVEIRMPASSLASEEASKQTRQPSRQTVGEIPQDTPRSRQITSGLSSQAKRLLQEKRKTKTSYDQFQLLSTPSWMSQKESNPWKEASQKHQLPLWRQVFETIMDKMNQEIWQYERRSILADIQSVILLLVGFVFLYKFGGPTVRWSVFIIRRFSFPAACVYLIMPTVQEQVTASKEGNNEGAYISRI